MTSWMSHMLLLAERDVFRDLGSGFREKKETLSGMDLLLYFVLVAALFAAIGLIAWIVGRRDQHQLFNSPRALFRTLSRAHGLDKSSRRLLQQIAASCKLKQPAELFVSPQHLAAARQATAFVDHRTQIDRLIAKLFFVESPVALEKQGVSISESAPAQATLSAPASVATKATASRSIGAPIDVGGSTVASNLGTPTGQ